MPGLQVKMLQSLFLSALALFIVSCEDPKASDKLKGRTGSQNSVGENSNSSNSDIPQETATQEEAVIQAADCAETTFTPINEGTPATTRGLNYQQKGSVCDGGLALIGAGVRQRLGDRYVLAAYSKTKTCAPNNLINTNEPKYLRLDILANSGANLVSGAIEDALNANLPADADADLLAKIDKVVEAFTIDFETGMVVEMFYQPGNGNIFRMEGKDDQLVDGYDVTKVLWSSFFSDNACCENAKTEILDYCDSNN